MKHAVFIFISLAFDTVPKKTLFQFDYKMKIQKMHIDCRGQAKCSHNSKILLQMLFWSFTLEASIWRRKM